jgi:hypothetical protein
VAISNDTAALVAAQLTAAYAARMGQRENSNHVAVKEEVLATYLLFKDKVSEIKIGKVQKVTLGGV